MIESADVVIVGGGAAGLASAIFAAEAAPGKRIVVLDGARSLGAKILVAGGGRCNVTHDVVTPDDFNGPRNVVRNILAAFDAAATVRWFASLGVQLKRENTGKLFPVTDSARTVLGALLRRCEDLRVALRTGSKVREVVTDGATFTLTSDSGQLTCPRLILSTGGRSLPRSGSDGSGWEIVRRLGHTVTDAYPALVPLVLDPQWFHESLAGVSQDVELSTFSDGKRIDRRRGSLLWTHFGISGPVAMDASRHWVIAKETGKQAEMKANLIPPEDFESAERWLLSQASDRPKAQLANVLSQRFPERVALAILGYTKVPPQLPGGQLSRDDRRRLIHALTALPIPVLHARGWNYAEVTAGGVPLSEIDYRTMASRKAPGLFLAGEILDCDGRIGGFNFQWAWSTGHLAGTAAGRDSGQGAA
ncbi:MAG TPA: NAD(P)/FAD-dependent oxidoreductase [Tepidisphaeraceae bacterium]|nr:NAD(P)/FAD-dependent oxidoreductase [Tepidisphaeraceae bacterium]